MIRPPRGNYPTEPGRAIRSPTTSSRAASSTPWRSPCWASTPGVGRISMRSPPTVRPATCSTTRTPAFSSGTSTPASTTSSIPKSPFQRNENQRWVQTSHTIWDAGEPGDGFGGEFALARDGSTVFAVCAYASIFKPPCSVTPGALADTGFRPPSLPSCTAGFRQRVGAAFSCEPCLPGTVSSSGIGPCLPCRPEQFSVENQQLLLGVPPWRAPRLLRHTCNECSPGSFCTRTVLNQLRTLPEGELPGRQRS